MTHAKQQALGSGPRFYVIIFKSCHMLCQKGRGGLA